MKKEIFARSFADAAPDFVAEFISLFLVLIFFMLTNLYLLVTACYVCMIWSI